MNSGYGHFMQHAMDNSLGPNPPGPVSIPGEAAATPRPAARRFWTVMRAVRWDCSARWLLLACFGFALWCTLSLALDEWRGRSAAPDLVRAAATKSGNEQYWLRLAALSPETERIALREALAANPRNSAAWIELALAEERAASLFTQPQGGPARPPLDPEIRALRLKNANLYLSEAAKVDRQFTPAWSQANFAFRNGDSSLFWEAGGRSARMAYDDLRPLLDLASRMGADPLAVIHHWGDESLPSGLRVRRAYLGLLAGQKRWNEVQIAARQMLARPPSVKNLATNSREQTEDNAHLAALMDLQLGVGRSEDAAEIWNALGPPPRHASVPFTRELENSITNPDFAWQPTNRGFDWRVFFPDNLAPDNVSFRWRPGLASFTFTGGQASEIVILEQPIVFAGTPRADYRLSTDLSVYSKKSNIGNTGESSEPGHAFFWSVTFPESSVHQEILLPVGAAGNLQLPLTHKTVVTARLRLLYRRPAGVRNFRGQLSIRRVALVPISSTPDLYPRRSSSTLLHPMLQEVP